MPEGDTIHRAAAALDRALAGRTILRFESVFPRLTRIDVDNPLSGRTIERVTARGKHLLFWFSGDLVLRTHMRMTGGWHLYRRGERWQRPRHDMRIVISTNDFDAVAFNVPVAEFGTVRETERALAILGPDLLADDFDAADAVRRIAERADASIADALLDQTAIAGIGNVYKSEALFATGINPFTPVRDLSHEEVERVVSMAQRMMRANTRRSITAGTSTARRTTGRMDPSARLWVYGRGGQPCRRCGAPIRRTKQGADARVTYWCERCQGVMVDGG
jgi:endonuclease-8